MDDLLFNFDASNATAAPPKKAAGGRWTARIGRKQKIKRTLQNSKPIATPVASPAPTAPTSAPTRATGKSNAKPKSKPAAQDDAAPKPAKFISSLFTSLPSITPQASTSKTVLEDSVPSNAPGDADFSALGIYPELRKALEGPKFNLQRPTAVQRLAIPKLLQGTTDTILQAQTGSGKTIAYLLPILQDLIRLNKEANYELDRTIGTLAIVLVPTRELAQQVYQVALQLVAAASGKSEQGDEAAGSLRWLVPGVLSGGVNRQHEKARLRKGVPLLIATPGRLIDHLEGTKAFRLGGERLRQKPKHTAKQDQDEFDVEDAPYVAEPGDDASSDEDFTKQAKSRSYRSRPLKKLEHMVSLRWLVLDEADRLMDMGFEPQVRKIIDQLNGRAHGNKRLSVLCSATIQGNVEKLAGYALNQPQLIKQDEEEEVAKSFVQHAPPSQLLQHYAVVPEKLRLVGLLALLRDQLKDNSKTIVFVSSTASVDFHWEALAGMQMGRNEEDREPRPAAEGIVATCMLFPNASLFRLHGNLDLATRLDTIRHYTACTTSAVLFCTSVASRGLDIPGIRSVIQYDLPTEGGALEYIHRVGRTARAGRQGEAWAFLLPSETGYVKWLEAKMGDDKDLKNRLREAPVENLLKKGYGGDNFETRATDVQMAIERWVEEEENTALARTAFASQVRAYATHPAEEKAIFHVKNIHLGHLAKSFGLREAPAVLGKLIGKGAAPAKADSKKRPRPEDDAGTDSEVEDVKKGVKQPRTGRALEGRGLKPATANSRGEFNIA